MCAILALAEKRYRRSVEVLQHKLKSERQIRVFHQTRAGGQDGWNWPYFLGVYEQKHARKKKKKKRTKPIFSHLDRTSLDDERFIT